MKFLFQRKGGTVGASRGILYLVALSAMVAVTAIVVSYFALAQHRNFLTIAYDTAVLQSGIVNTLHGNLLGNNGFGGPSILGVHTLFILLLIAPIYALAPSADTLFVMQACGVYSTVIPLYLIAEDLLRNQLLAFFVAAGAMASPLLFHMALAPFHPETWIIAAAFWSYLFYLRDNRAGFWLSFFFAISCGEQAALIFIALGASLLLTDDGLAWRKRYGILALVAGFAWIILAVEMSTLFRHSARSFNIFAYNYSQWRIKSAFDLPMVLVQRPMDAISLLTKPLRWEHLLTLIGLPLFGALFSWRSLVLLAPFPVYFLMSDQEFFLYFHAYYYSFAFFAGYLGLLIALGRWVIAGRLDALLLSCTFLINILLLCSTVGSYLQMNSCRDDEFSNTLHMIFAKIPPEATVYSPHRYSAYLSNRQNIVIGDLREEHVDFKAMMDADFEITNVHPEQVDYIVCDYMTDQCGWRSGYLSSELIRRRTENIGRLVQSGQWRIFWSKNDVVILCRAGK